MLKYEQKVKFKVIVMVRFPKKYQLKDGTQVIAKTIIQDYWTKEKSVVFVKEFDETFYSLSLDEFAKIVAQEPINLDISLYKNLFKGRTDIFANRYYNKKQQRYVYAPVYQWEQEAGRSGIKVDSNGNRVYEKFEDKFLINHLKGQKFLGVYPILKDDTCYFLALDFDKNEWEAAVKAVAEVSKSHGLTATIEKSQSGQGAHVWFFFEEALSCKLARRLGTLLLTQAMAVEPSISFSSFDRMFPSQDTLPKRGFGNLIALPLQGNRVLEGKSVFLDENLNPYQNQWAYLASILKYSRKKVGSTIDQLDNENDLQYYKEERLQPIELLAENSEEMLDSLVVYESNVLTIRKDELTKKAILKLKGLSSFHNPEFYQRQTMRQPTYKYPRIISLFNESKDEVYIPRGLKKQLKQIANDVQIVDMTTKGKKVNVTFNAKLTKEQKEALEITKKQNMGVISAHTGFGKTVLACKMIAHKKVNTLILVQNKNLADQWKRELNKFLSIKNEPLVEFTDKGRQKKKDKVGQIYGSKFKRSNLVDVATFQSLVNKDSMQEILDQYGMVIIDECHHVAAFTFEKVIKNCKMQYIYGLSATPKRKDGHDPIIFMRCGEIIWQAKKQAEDRLNKQLLIPRFITVGDEFGDAIATNEIHENYRLITNNEKRNSSIIEDILNNINEGKHILVISERVEHLKELSRQLSLLESKQSFPIYELNGKVKETKRKEILDSLQKEKSPYVLLATGKYVGEGFDLASLDTICLTMPISWSGLLQQYLGRLQRNLSQKSELRVYDYVDFMIPMFSNMYQKRLTTYRKLGYEVLLDANSQEKHSEIFTSQNYFASFIDDLKKAENDIVLSVPFLSKKVIKELADIKDISANVSLWTMDPQFLHSNSQKKQKEYLAKLEQIGIKVYQSKTKLQNVCVIDKTIVWYGSINFLSYAKEETSALRLAYESIATEFYQMFTKDKF